MSIVLVEQPPSRQELLDMVNKFLEEKKYPKDYKSKNKGSSVEFLFSNIVLIKFYFRIFHTTSLNTLI
jgi:hypothetical protein